MYRLMLVMLMSITMSISSFIVPANNKVNPPINCPIAKTLPDSVDCVNLDYFDELAPTVVIYDSEYKRLGCGTGFIFHGKKGETYVWTAAHVLARTRKAFNKFEGSVEVLISLKGDRDKIIGRTTYDAEILKYSHHPNLKDKSLGEDLAILKISKKKLGRSVEFCDPNEQLKLGLRVWHAGTMTGWFNGLTVTEGILGHTNVDYMSKSYYQFTVMSLCGASGGPLLRKSDGKLVAMLTRGRDGSYNLTVPTWRMIEWADRVNATYAYDNKLDFNKGPIEADYPALEDEDKETSSKYSSKICDYFSVSR